MSSNRVYIVYGFNSDYSGCGDGDGKVHFLKAFTDEEEAKNLAESLNQERKDIDKKFQHWHNTERRQALDNRNPDEDIMVTLREVQKTSPTNEWKHKDIHGELMNFQNTYFSVQEMTVA
jgi:2,3-bisphosphoglycerate-independent phosphoglycerate mutase